MIKISQSVINSMCDFDACGQHIKFKYFDKVEGAQSDVMFRGNYFEYFVLGDTRDHNFPEFENVNRKNLKPTKSASKKVKEAYLLAKGVTPDGDIDEQLDLMPEDRSEGEKCVAQKELDELVQYTLNILLLMGIKPSEGESQVKIETDTLIGHLDHVNKDFAQPTRKAIYDLKYTETKENDRWNGWGDITQNSNALTQAKHYIKLYHEKHGEWIPFYFLVFGKSKWVKCFKVTLSEEGLEAHDRMIESITEQLQGLEQNNFPATPKFNKCAKCEFNQICDFRKMIPEIEEVNL